jgi:hypothetical protein
MFSIKTVNKLLQIRQNLYSVFVFHVFWSCELKKKVLRNSGLVLLVGFRYVFGKNYN